MNVILTGRTGCGKSTVCMRLLEQLTILKIKCGGVLSPAVGGDSEASGSDAVNVSTGERLVSSRPKKHSPFLGVEVGDYVVDPQIIGFIMRAVEGAKDSDVIFVDEVGPIELKNDDFISALSKTVKSGKNTVLVVREKLLEKFMNMFPGVDFKVYDVNNENRGILTSILADIFSGNT